MRRVVHDRSAWQLQAQRPMLCLYVAWATRPCNKLCITCTIHPFVKGCVSKSSPQTVALAGSRTGSVGRSGLCPASSVLSVDAGDRHWDAAIEKSARECPLAVHGGASLAVDLAMVEFGLGDLVVMSFAEPSKRC